MKNRKTLLSLLLVAIMVFGMMAGCAKKDEPTPPTDGGTTTPPVDSTDKPKSDTLVVATADETPSLTTYGHNAVAGDYVNQLTHNGLFRIDENMNPVPDLCESYEVAKDAKGEETIWTFKLKSDVKFHDGTVMTADDVKASLEFVKDKPEVAQYTKSTTNIVVVDPLTIQITTEGVKANLLYDLAHHSNYVMPKALLDSGNDFNKNPIGTGPYKFVSWDRSDKITFVMNEEYFDKDAMPTIKNLLWKVVPEGSSRTMMLETGEVQMVIELDSTAVESLKANPDVVVLQAPSVSHNWLCINNEKKPFDDVNVRKAINSAINKQSVIEVALNGMGQPALSQTPVGMLGESTANTEEYSVEKAKEYMAAWGGDPATIELSMICSNDTKRRAAEVIQANLKEIGINASIESMDLATYLDVTKVGDFTGFIGGYTSNEMMSFLNGVFHSKSINASNKTRINDPKIDALIDQATNTVDQEARGAVLKEVTEYLNTLTPEIPLYQDDYLRAYAKDLKGVEINAGGVLRFNKISW